MEKEKFQITLADGTVIEGLTQNGDNYVSETEVNVAVFESNCSPMTITGSDSTEVLYQNGEFIRQAHFPGVQGYYLAFRDKTANELALEEIQAKIEYIGMMANIEL